MATVKNFENKAIKLNIYTYQYISPKKKIMTMLMCNPYANVSKKFMSQARSDPVTINAKSRMLTHKLNHVLVTPWNRDLQNSFPQLVKKFPVFYSILSFTRACHLPV